ncbi:MAG: hypothetical protein WC527_01405 [Candidatus Margulisiibacteriota bacterium]
MEPVSSKQLPPAFYRAPEDLQRQVLSAIDGGKRSVASGIIEAIPVSDSTLNAAGKVGGGVGVVAGAAAGTLAVAAGVIATAPITIPLVVLKGATAAGAIVLGGAVLTSCPGPMDPQTGESLNYDTEKTLPPEESSNTPLVEPDGSIKSKNLGIRLGGTENFGLPVLTVGITNADWGFTRLEGNVGFLRINPENLPSNLRDKTAFGEYDSIYEGDIDNHYVEKADTTDKPVAIMRLSEDAALYGEGDFFISPVIGIMGDKINAYSGKGGLSDPLHWFAGINAPNYYDTGLKIQAPYYYEPDYSWSVWTYMKRMPISGETGNFVPDPRESSVWTWPMDDWREKQGIPMPMFAVRYPKTSDISMFNVIPIASSGTVDERINFLRTAMPRTAPGLAEIQERSIDNIPDDGEIYLIAERGKKNAGLLYTAPDGPESHRTTSVGMQIMVRYPKNTVPSSNVETCDLHFIHQVKDVELEGEK